MRVVNHETENEGTEEHGRVKKTKAMSGRDEIKNETRISESEKR